WRDRPFGETTFEPALNSGPYRISEVAPGRRLVFERVRNYWGRDLPINRGKYNVDRMEVELYRGNNVAFEAFKAGEFDIYLEHKASNWANAYDFPAVTSGAVLKRAIQHEIPASTQGLFFNTRRAPFDRREVRQALGMLFDFEWSNRVLFHEAYRRSLSYFPNSPFSATGLPAGQEFLFLEPFRQHLPPDEIPASTQGLFFNTRRAPFDRREVRQALGMLFDFEWSNRVLFHEAYRRSLSYFPNSPFSATGLPAGQEFLFLEPFRQHLPP